MQRTFTILLLGSLLLLLLPPGVAQAATFIVNTVDDLDDGLCDSVHCSLREALAAAEAAPGLDTISFDTPGAGPHVIVPTTPYPTISQPLALDGTTEPDYVDLPVIVIHGTYVDPLFNFTGDGSTIRGLSLSHLSVTGINISGDNNVIEGNLIGIDALSGEADGARDALYITGDNNRIGGTTAAQRNVISASQTGVNLQNRARDNRVEGNYIGTDPTGTLAMGNQVGVNLGNEAEDNTIGGTLPEQRNIISGNNQFGVLIDSQGSLYNNLRNTIEGNYIGVDVTGSAALPNHIGVQAQRASVFPTGYAIVTIEENVISGNTGSAVVLTSTSRWGEVRGNYIGTDASALLAIPNGDAGMVIAGLDHVIGGLTAPVRNIIAGNQGAGIVIEGANGVFVQNNYIGVNAAD
ncbi:MAG: right-handed parallel beta-helix repeat-containing protein, partial [Anaerolineae bacterium]|nr:right-handed parallel beta-helix repeat-containing protein [Anaerolineae bacterium]